MPDPNRLLPTITRAIALTQDTLGRAGRVITIPEGGDILIAGDLHGNLPNFQKVFSTAQLGAYPKRHLVLQEVIHSPFRYPTGGDKSHQILDLYSALKCQFPNRVHLIMGNHEMAQWLGRVVIKNDEDYNQCFIDGVHAAYGSSGTLIYEKYLELFSVLPLAIRTPNRLLVSHSLPSSKYLPQFTLDSLMQDDLPVECYEPGGMAYALVWGRDATARHAEQFLKQVDCDWLVSGHIPCDTGFTFPNHRQLILDCAHSPGAYALLPIETAITPESFLTCVRVIG